MHDAIWTKVCSFAELHEDQGKPVVIDGRKLAVFLVDGSPCVVSDACPHGNALLSQGWVEDGTVECPLHQARFDLRTGRVLCGPAKQDAQRFEACVRDGGVLVSLPAEVQA